MIAAMALWVLVLLMPLTVAMLALGSTEVHISRNHVQHTQAGFSCESGLEVAFHAVQTGQPVPPNWTTPELGTVTMTYTPISTDEGQIQAAAVFQGAKASCSARAWRPGAGTPWQTKAYHAH